MDRRKFFKLSLSVLALASLAPGDLFALWNKRAFKASSYQKALQATFGKRTLIPTNKISLDLPKVATNSATVPVKVNSSLKNVKEVAIFVEKNTSPLTLHVELSPKMLPMLSTRIKMLKSSKVHVVAKAGNKYYTTSAHVKVNAEAC